MPRVPPNYRRILKDQTHKMICKVLYWMIFPNQINCNGYLNWDIENNPCYTIEKRVNTWNISITEQLFVALLNYIILFDVYLTHKHINVCGGGGQQDPISICKVLVKQMCTI